jgi:hypothetical protein
MRLGEWINRKRHNRGFGIQSPSAFFFITEVLNERLPYYAYKKLDHAIEECGGMSKRHARELFRITNYAHPTNCISVAAETAGHVMAAARPGAPCHSVEGESVENFICVMKECKEVGMLYVAECPARNAIVEAAMERTNNSSVIIVEGINDRKATQEWWQSIVNSPQAIVTYDMYSYGILFFDNDKKKQHYKLKR